MEENKEQKVGIEKPPYEQLENYLHQLSEQNRQLQTTVRSLNDGWKQLSVMFELLKFKDSFPEEYITKVVNTIMEMCPFNSKEEVTEEK